MTPATVLTESRNKDSFGSSYFEGSYYEYGSRRVSVEQQAMDALKWAEKRGGPSIFDGESKKALDVGCAYGYVLSLLTRFGYDAVGIDVSRFAVAKALETRNSKANYLIHSALMSSATSLPFAKAFDLITCFEVLEHLQDPVVALASMWDALKPGGMIVASTPNRIALYHRVLDRDETHISVHSYFYWKRQIWRLKDLKNAKVECFGPLFPSKLTGRSFIVRMPIFGHSTRILAVKSNNTLVGGPVRPHLPAL